MDTPYEVTIEELKKEKIPYVVVRNVNHIMIRFTINEKKFSVTCSKTASDFRATIKAKCLVKRMIREGKEHKPEMKK